LRTLLLQACGAALLLGGTAAAEAADPPSWAYPIRPADLVPRPDDGSVLHVADSSAGFTRTQLGNPYEAADWHPEDHPPMPAVVAHGRPPEVYACGYCHRADGSGGPENARLAGLPFGYILQQLADFRSGARRTAVPARRPHALMAGVARALTQDEARAAAAYFAVLKPRRSIRVVETDTVPRTVNPGWFLAPAPGGATETLGRRIIEVPEDVEDFERRDTRARFIAYVPPGSLARGAAIVTGSAGGKTPPCATCHGAGLRGLGNAPGLAGRSPSYVVRQFYDIAAGARAGQAVQVMKGLLARLDEDDRIAVAAYLASLEP
jgi:cytochrome c553